MADPMKLPEAWSASSAAFQANDMLRRVDAVSDPAARELLIELISIFRAKAYSMARMERPEVQKERELNVAMREAIQPKPKRKPWWRVA